MPNPFKKIINFLADKFKNDPSKMLIWTGAAGWALSSLAQLGGILFNSKYSEDQKSFLLPQEAADAFVNIMAFVFITQSAKKLTSKLFRCGKLAPKKTREFLNNNKELYGKKVGKLDFDLDSFCNNKDFPTGEYETCKNFFTTIATVGAGVVSTNIITPIIRNNMASKMKNNYDKYKAEQNNLQKPAQPQIIHNGNMRI